MKPAGFKKKGYLFSKNHAEYTEVFHFQPSASNRFGGSRSFYINCGIVFPDFPKPKRWSGVPTPNHGAGRLECFLSEVPGSWCYSEDTINTIIDEVGKYLMQASDAIASNIAQYRQSYLDNVAKAALDLESPPCYVFDAYERDENGKLFLVPYEGPDKHFYVSRRLAR
jgi:hypothetical protein